MTSIGVIPRVESKPPTSDDEIAKEAAEEILWYAQNDLRKIYEIVLRAIFQAKHPDN